jgi:hypothetical protein
VRLIGSKIMVPPARIATLANLGETGLDEQAGLALRCELGRSGADCAKILLLP